MYKPILLITLLLVGAAVACAGVELTDFRAFPVVDHSQLQWSTGVEDNFQMFVVERSSDSRNFYTVGTVNGTGSYSQYQFTDTSPLLDNSRTFYYRLKMVDRDGTYRYSEIREVSLTFSAVQHTWGSIKAMFR